MSATNIDPLNRDTGFMPLVALRYCLGRRSTRRASAAIGFPGTGTCCLGRIARASCATSAAASTTAGAEAIPERSQVGTSTG